MPLFFDFIRQILFFAGYIGSKGSFGKPFTAKEERERIMRMQNGDENARNELIEHNLRLAAHIAKKYSASGAEMDDLVSIGTVGLIKAVNTFSYDKSAALSGYAAKCIENEILMYLRSVKKRSCEVSLFLPIGEDKEGNKLSLEDIMEASESDVTEIVEEKTEIEKLSGIIASVLDIREFEVIKLRYGLMGEDILPQREVAKRMGISRSYVSRIEKRALEKLNAALEMK